VSDTAPTIALLPLDERPVNTRYPQMLAEIAGATVLLPPAAALGSQREPADGDAIDAWLRDAALRADGGVIVSAEYLTYGNLISSRISNDSVGDALARLRLIEEIGANGTPVYAFSLITRVSNADDAVEEPDYWATYGTRFYRYSGLLHRRDAGALAPAEAEQIVELETALPPGLRLDWLRRRLRNHTVNLALLDLLMRDRLAFLLITSDDTSPWGLPSREKRILESWIALLGDRAASRTMLHPGADEVGSALVARLLVSCRPAPPRICPVYAIPGDEALVAPYEDRAVRETVEGQIRACGGVLAADPETADIVLGVLTPSPGRREWRADFADADRAARTPPYRALFALLGEYQRTGRPVALADVAYPNGADPLALQMLLEPDSALDPAGLAAYGAWNTAGNTLGVVVAQAICAQLTGGRPEGAAAQSRFLAHRFLEDWGYQAVVRRTARERNRAAFGADDPDPDSLEQIAYTCASIDAGLREKLLELQARGVGAGLEIAPGSVRLPWRRTFEADFALRLKKG
jgi:hypothetical protein